MTAASVQKSVAPIPADLPQLLHAPKTPWHISPVVFERIKAQSKSATVNKRFTTVAITNKDPEYAFVFRYFQHQKPPGYSIKAITCVHNPDQTMMFEGSLIGMEAAAKAFAPAWNKEEPVAARAKTIERWKAAAAPFSPFQIASSKRVDKFFDVKVLPLWHGSKHIDSICQIGFTFFGKHHLLNKLAKAGAEKSTDIGYFGSGIYLTNSAHYASMYAKMSNSNSLLLTWVAMREPYPVVNDVPIPKKGSDMLKLQGGPAYQNYNAHYIPVTSVDPKDSENMVYYPCHHTDEPAWDEYVVFQTTQALPRFIVELGVDLPVAPSSASIASSVLVATVGALTEKLMALLDDPVIQSDSALFALLTEKSNILLNLNSQSPLSSEDLAFYNRTVKLLDSNGKVRAFIKQQLTQLQPAVPKPTITPFVASLPALKPTSALQKKDTESNKKENSVQAIHSLPHLDSSDESPPPPPPEDSVESLDNKLGAIGSASVNIDPKSLEETDAYGCTPLLHAAKTGDKEHCTSLLAAGANVNAIDNIGFNALHLAAWNGKHEIIPLFATYKQLLNAKDTEGNTPLMFAAYYGLPKACEALLKAGADPSVVDDRSGKNALHYAAQEGKHEVIPLFVPYKQLLNAKDTNGYTPLILAAYRGLPKACEALLKLGADPSATDKSGRSALDLAHQSPCSFKDEVIKLLSSYNAQQPTSPQSSAQKPYAKEDPPTQAKITKVATAARAVSSSGETLNQKSDDAVSATASVDPKALETTDWKGYTPLLNAAEAGDVELCKSLIAAGANLYAVEKNGSNALQIAARNGKHEVIPLFAAHKQLLNAKTTDGIMTPLMLAAYQGHLKACEALLKAGADPAIINVNGWNALHCAASSGKHEVIPVFAAYKQLLNAKDTNGTTPLMTAIFSGHSQACTALLQAGADPNAIWNDGKNALHTAAHWGHHEVILLFAAYKQLLNAKDTDGNTPLIEAVYRGHPKACEALLKAGADPFITDKLGLNALLKAAQHGKHEVIPLFATHKQLLNAKDTDGETPLLLAVFKGHPKACEALLKAGADPFITDKQGQNALHKAAQLGSHEVISLFAAYKQLLNAKDTNGYTPLMVAVSIGASEACKALLQAGADPSITKGGILGLGGDNALDLARRSTSSSKDEVIKLLSSYKK